MRHAGFEFEDAYSCETPPLLHGDKDQTFDDMDETNPEVHMADPKNNPKMRYLSVLLLLFEHWYVHRNTATVTEIIMGSVTTQCMRSRYMVGLKLQQIRRSRLTRSHLFCELLHYATTPFT